MSNVKSATWQKIGRLFALVMLSMLTNSGYALTMPGNVDVTQLINAQQQGSMTTNSSSTSLSNPQNGIISTPAAMAIPNRNTPTLPTTTFSTSQGASATPLNSQQPPPVLSQPATLPNTTPENLVVPSSLPITQNTAFGANLFTGAFSKEGPAQFNPDYAIAVGDSIQVRFWGAFEFDAPLTVDPKGNIFLPHVGPVHVLNVHNQDLQGVVESMVGRVFRHNVYCYASLATAQPVRVFVGGFVNRPGLYGGTSMDSLLHYIDQAGGIDLDRGSFLNVQVKRGKTVRGTVNLYDFLLRGQIPQIQLADGDVVFVSPQQNTINVIGLADNANRFEFDSDTHTVADLIELAKPKAEVTHIRITRSTGTIKNVEYYPLEQASKIAIEDGDELEITADKKPGTITVRVEGEHQSQQEYVLPYGSRLGSLLSQIKFSDRSDVKSLQLFRASVKVRQKDMLDNAIKRLETTVLNARSGTAEESVLRSTEAEMVLKWVERAKTLQPSGQVMIAQTSNANQLLLESGDVINVPSLDNLVLVNGEVVFPNSIAYDPQKDVDDYIQLAGGYSQDADRTRIVLAHRDGSFEETQTGLFTGNAIRSGDEIMVMPDVDPKYRQLFKEVSMMIYQMALGARVILR